MQSIEDIKYLMQALLALNAEPKCDYHITGDDSILIPHSGYADAKFNLRMQAERFQVLLKSFKEDVRWNYRAKQGIIELIESLQFLEEVYEDIPESTKNEWDPEFRKVFEYFAVPPTDKWSH